MTTEEEEEIDREELCKLVLEFVHAHDADEPNQNEQDFWIHRQQVQKEDADEATKVFASILKDNAQLDRILVARKHKAEPSLQLLLQQVRFRAKWRPEQIDPKSIATALPSGAIRMAGYSKEGCPIANYKLEFWNPSEYEGDLQESIDEYTRYVVYMSELMIARMKPGFPQQFVVIFDLTGYYLSMAASTRIRQMIGALIYIGQTQYPERLGKVLLVNPPYGFQTAWSLITPWLDERTTSKIAFESNENLLVDVDMDVLSVAYGGNHPEYPIPTKTIEEEVASEVASD